MMASPERTVLVLLAASLVHSATAQTFPVYGQCGGSGFTSTGTCASGAYCQSENPYYCTTTRSEPTT